MVEEGQVGDPGWPVAVLGHDDLGGAAVGALPVVELVAVQEDHHVGILYRDEVYNRDTPDRGTAEVIVAKHRNGPIGVTHLAFLDHYTRFANMARV